MLLVVSLVHMHLHLSTGNTSRAAKAEDDDDGGHHHHHLPASRYYMMTESLEFHLLFCFFEGEVTPKTTKQN
jgi:hypothetical protein